SQRLVPVIGVGVPQRPQGTLGLSSIHIIRLPVLGGEGGVDQRPVAERRGDCAGDIHRDAVENEAQHHSTSLGGVQPSRIRCSLITPPSCAGGKSYRTAGVLFGWHVQVPQWHPSTVGCWARNCTTAAAMSRIMVVVRRESGWSM